MDDRFDIAWRTLTATIADLPIDGTVRIKLGPRLHGELPLALDSGQNEVAITRLEIGETLGEGGRGIVRRARQVLLDREVAVKSLRRDIPTRRLGRELLSEAVITGGLEHPNIVPVYDLIADADGSPIIIMKRIGGTPWKAFVERPELISETFGVEDHLRWHLEVLRSVCHAVAFAHDKGLLHRDLKTDNVMVGQFNEVYVLDWGCAVGLHAGLSAHVPLASEIRVAEGTPAFMAPEMVTAQADRINQTTDIYLLGAILHNLLTGTPRHQGETLKAVLQAAYRSEPVSYGPQVPAELAALCASATARDQADRPQSVAAFEAALGDFLEHRESVALCDEAMPQLERLRVLLNAAGDRSREALYGQFAVCRFGFKQALRSWPENREATRGLSAAIGSMIGYELAQRDGAAASLLLAQLPEPDVELAAKVDQLRRELAHEAEQLERLRRDHDPRFGSRPRAYSMIIFAIITGCWPLVTAWLIKLPSVEQVGRARFWAVPVVYVTFALLLRRFAPRLFVSQLNRNLLSMGIALGISSLLLRIAGVHMSLAIGQIMILEKVMFGFCAAALGIVITDRRILLSAAIFAGGALTAMHFPWRLLEIFAITNTLGIGWIGVIWLQQDAQRATTAER